MIKNVNLDKFTYNSKFLMLALDHRGSFKKLINPQDPDSVSNDTVIQLKSEIIQALADQFSGLLIDEVWGLEACKDVCQTKPFLLPLEKSGYTRSTSSGQVEEDGEKITELEYSVEQIKEMGASGAKLLLYFNPNAKSAFKQIETAKKVIEDCKQNDFPFFLEIVTHKMSGQKLLDREVNGNSLVLDSIRKFLDAGVAPDVWKLEYPGSLEACQQLTSLAGNTPWILLTGGQSFEEFKPQLETATKGGAKGFLAGRAIWQEVCTFSEDEKQKFLDETLPERFKEVLEIAIKS